MTNTDLPYSKVYQEMPIIAQDFAFLFRYQIYVGWSSQYTGTVHDRTVYILCPDVLNTVGKTSEWIGVGFIESDKILTIFLFIYLFLYEVQSLLLSS